MRWKIGIVFLVLLMASSASATSIESEEVTIDLSDNTVIIESEIETITTSRYSYVTSVPVNDVQGTLNGEPIDCTASEFQIGSDIQCEAPEKENVSVTLEFTATNLVEQRNGYSLFQYSHSVYRPTDRYKLNVLLPENSGVADSSNKSEESVIPATADISNANGRSLITWDTEPQLGEVLSFRTIYEEEVPEENSNLPVFLIIIIVVASLGLAYLITREPDREDIELESDEQQVVDILRENDGEMLQKDVVSESEYSKAKISGVVGTLVDKEVLTKEKEGRSNKLVLQKLK